MWFELLSIVIGICSAVYFYLVWNFEYWRTRGVLAPKPKVFFGNFGDSGKRKCHATDEFTRMYNDYKGRANFIGIYQMRSPRILILEPDLVKEILVKSFSKFRDNEFSSMFNEKSDPLFSRNPFLSRSDVWKERRAEISPAFSSNRMKAIYPLISDVCERLSVFIRDNFDQPIEARDLSSKFTTETVSSCIFGIEANSLQKDDNELRKMSKGLFKPSLLAVINIMITSVFPSLKSVLKVQFVPDNVNNFFMQLIEQAVNYRIDNKIKRDDFLDYLITLQKKKGFSSTDLAGHSITFFSDGLETSSVLIAHTMYELAKNVQAQEKLRKEIDEFHEQHGKITFDLLNEMSYLDQITNETLRLHPPFTMISKECSEETELEYIKGTKVTVEKGMNIYLPLYQLQRDAEFYPKPNDFIPERFAPEHGGLKAFRDKGVFLSFGDGPRLCLGMKFAVVQSKAAIVEIIRNFKITVNEKTEDPLVLDPTEFLNIKRGGLWLNFKPAKMFRL